MENVNINPSNRIVAITFVVFVDVGPLKLFVRLVL